MIVGGEFYENPRWVLQQPVLSTQDMTFLNGGKACLIVMAACLRDHGVDTVLLPSCLCPSVVDALEYGGLTCLYYQVRPDFSIDLQDLSATLGAHTAVYFINYFGFFHSPQTLAFLTDIQNQGHLLIEDNAQAGFPDHSIGDFVFNSLRKWVPFDGGYLRTHLDVFPYLHAHAGTINRRLPLIRAYRRKLADYVYGDTDPYEELVALYRQAETIYDREVVIIGDEEERHQIEHLDWAGICQKRRENYRYLLSLISEIRELEPVFPTLPDEVVPLGLPVYVNGVSRDALHTALGKAGIGLHIHWHELLTDDRLNRNETAVEMAGKILTLVIDQQTSHKQMDYMVQEIIRLMGRGKLIA